MKIKRINQPEPPSFRSYEVVLKIENPEDDGALRHLLACCVGEMARRIYIELFEKTHAIN